MTPTLLSYLRARFEEAEPAVADADRYGRFFLFCDAHLSANPVIGVGYAEGVTALLQDGTSVRLLPDAVVAGRMQPAHDVPITTLGRGGLQPDLPAHRII